MAQDASGRILSMRGVVRISALTALERVTDGPLWEKERAGLRWRGPGVLRPARKMREQRKREE